VDLRDSGDDSETPPGGTLGCARIHGYRAGRGRAEAKSAVGRCSLHVFPAGHTWIRRDGVHDARAGGVGIPGDKLGLACAHAPAVARRNEARRRRTVYMMDQFHGTHPFFRVA
jgi:hypothetical protein